MVEIIYEKQTFFEFLMLTIIACIIVSISGCTEKTETNVTGNIKEQSVQKIEVFHFHPTHQCYSCKTVGAYTEETVKTYFSDELDSGKIIFDHINIELPENRETVLKYGVTGSSLWIGVYRNDGNFSKEQNLNVWYKITDKENYMTYLKQVLEQKLNVG